MTKTVTIYEVAERAGVSTATVSNTLNRPGRVGVETRERVLAVADELGFVPKSQAVNQARRGMRRIGVVAPFSSYPSFYQRLSGVVKQASAHGLEVSIFDVESAATAPSPVLASIPIRGQVDGLIVMGERLEESIERRLSERGLPTVLVDADSARFSSVGVDDVQGGRLAARHLLSLGHQRFGFVAERQHTGYASQSLRRLEGFRQEIDEVGNCELLVVDAPFSSTAACRVGRDLLTSPSRPSAVMSYCDELAVGVLHAAAELQLSVPTDVAVMGYDDGPQAAAVSLTTMRQPLAESGAIATQILLSAIDGDTSQSTTNLAATLVVRSTTSPASSA